MSDDSHGSLSGLPEHAKTGLGRGGALLEWWTGREKAQGVKRFELLPPQGSLVEMSGFYDELEVEGRRTPVMGCLQRARFEASPQGAKQRPLDAYIKQNFMRLATWRHPDGSPGGFGYTPLLYKLRQGGQCAAFSGGEDDLFLDLRDVSTRYDWLVLQVDIHDFVRSFPPLKKYARRLSKIIREAAYVVMHDDYFQARLHQSRKDVVAESLFGYSFLPCAVEPNFFGFGPGRFWAAIKLFRFLLLEDGALEIQLDFIVAPRSEKVLYFWGFDPVYTAVHLADLLTLRQLGIRQWVHDRVDAVMLRLHGQVHQNLLEGMRDVWTGNPWVAD